MMFHNCQYWVYTWQYIVEMDNWNNVVSQWHKPTVCGLSLQPIYIHLWWFWGWLQALCLRHYDQTWWSNTSCSLVDLHSLGSLFHFETIPIQISCDSVAHDIPIIPVNPQFELPWNPDWNRTYRWRRRGSVDPRSGIDAENHRVCHSEIH